MGSSKRAQSPTVVRGGNLALTVSALLLFLVSVEPCHKHVTQMKLIPRREETGAWRCPVGAVVPGVTWENSGMRCLGLSSFHGSEIFACL